MFSESNQQNKDPEEGKTHSFFFLENMEAFSLTQFAVLSNSSYAIYPAHKVMETPGKLVI